MILQDPKAKNDISGSRSLSQKLVVQDPIQIKKPNNSTSGSRSKSQKIVLQDLDPRAKKWLFMSFSIRS